MLQFLVGDVLISGYLAYEGLPNLCFRADPRKNLAYYLWIKAPTEKSWIVFKLEEDLEPNEVIQALGGGPSRFKLSKEGVTRLGDSDLPTYPPGFGSLCIGSGKQGEPSAMDQNVSAQMSESSSP
ncbi:hypothetical protein LIER_17722 [Lithospermum erythrorhizon]|uniref:Uncharacterized protein n=1 Tax=Lithospermum erythrorhizon TaxID=34254 RepID=A0AAV3QCF4_LITER